MKITELVSHFSISLILMLVLFSGCGDTSVGDDVNNQDPSFPAENLSFSGHIQPILSNSCASCHGAQGLSGVSLNNYDNMMSSVGDCYGKNIVIPGEPDESPILDIISSNSPECAERMPQGGPFLSSEQTRAIRTWIEEGADDN